MPFSYQIVWSNFESRDEAQTNVNKLLEADTFDAAIKKNVRVKRIATQKKIVAKKTPNTKKAVFKFPSTKTYKGRIFSAFLKCDANLRTAVSQQELTKTVFDSFSLEDTAQNRRFVKLALNRGVNDGTFSRVKNSFKIASADTRKSLRARTKVTDPVA